MKKVLLAAIAAIVLFVRAGEDGATFKMAVKGRPQVTLARLSYDQTIIHALDEFILYMNAALKTTDYDGRDGLFTLDLAVAGD